MAMSEKECKFSLNCFYRACFGKEKNFKPELAECVLKTRGFWNYSELIV